MFWKKLHLIYHFDIKRTVLIDDNEDVLTAAENHGIANLITIARPDSQQPKRKNCKFATINNFYLIYYVCQNQNQDFFHSSQC